MNFDFYCGVFATTILLGTTSSLSKKKLDSRLSDGLATDIWWQLSSGSATIEGTVERSGRLGDEANISLITVYDIHTNRTIMDLSLDLKHHKASLLLPTQDGFVIFSFMCPHFSLKEHRVIFTVEQQRVEVIVDCIRVLSVMMDDLHFARYKMVKVIIGKKTVKTAKIKHIVLEPSIIERCTELQVFRDNPDVIRDSTEIIYTASDLENNNYPLSNSSQMNSWKLNSKIGKMRQWKTQLDGIEQRLGFFENRNTFCLVDGLKLAIGDRRIQSNCTECTCRVDGEVRCKKIDCPYLECQLRIRERSDCCERCPRNCFHRGQSYPHASEIRPHECEVCVCRDGTMECSYQKPKVCPSLTCARDRQYIPKNECCEVCDTVDHCIKKPCAQYADCTNGRGEAICKCRQGFYGDGKSCYDIDECLWNEDARAQLGGCSIGTVCQNLPGSFRCDCLPGHQRLDQRNCLDIIRL